MKTLLLASALLAAATPALAQYVYSPPPQAPVLRYSNGAPVQPQPLVPVPFGALYNTLNYQNTPAAHGGPVRSPFLPNTGTSTTP